MGQNSGPMKGLGIFGKNIDLNLSQEIVLYTGKSPLEAPLIL